MATNILVVDDEPDVRQLFKITLSMAGYEAAVASDGLEALTAIGKEPPSLVLLDLMMPRLDGFGVLDKLREEKPEDDLKVLIATAKSLDERERERLKGWPVVGVLNKGQLDLTKLVNMVQKTLSPQPKVVGAAVDTGNSNGRPGGGDHKAGAAEKADPAKPKEIPSGQA